MNILHFLYDHINNPWVGGGGAVRVFEIYKRLSKRGHNITVVSGKYPNAKDYKVNNNFEYKFLGCPKNYVINTFSYAFKAMKFLKRNAKNYDLIVEDFAPWNPIFSYRFEKQKPIVLQLHHREGKNILKRYTFLGLAFYLIEKFYPKKFKNVIIVSEKTANKYNLNNCKVISNGINANLLNMSEKIGNYIFYVGRIDIYNKGLDLLVNAVRNSYKLLIAGNGKDKVSFLKIIKNYKNVVFLGFVNEKRKFELILNSKFLVMPSRFEGQGIVALEAAALGKPLIVSDIPELQYVVDNGFGVSFKTGNTDDLAKKIEFLWNNPDLIAQMGKRGREYAKNFTWDKVAEAYEKYLLNLVSNS